MHNYCTPHIINKTLRICWSIGATIYYTPTIILNNPVYTYMYTGYPGGNMSDFGRMFLKLKYTDITQNTYTRSWTFTEIMAKGKCGFLAFPRTVPGSHDVIPIRCALSVLVYSRLKRVHAATAHIKCLETKGQLRRECECFCISI